MGYFVGFVIAYDQVLRLGVKLNLPHAFRVLIDHCHAVTFA